MADTKSLAQIKTVAIIGLGLMGGSLAAALRKKMPRVRIVGITRRRTALKMALRKGWIHEGVSDVARGVRNADLIVLCSPVQTFPGLFRILNRHARPGALVTDVGSVKADILRRLPKGRLNYVSAHPMAGSHAHGIEAVNPALYDQGFVFIIRDTKASPKAYKQVKAFWTKIMPRMVEISARDHDRWTAEISHMPHALAVCLMLAAPDKGLPYAARGFRDMTRLAAGSPDIWLPIFQANRRFMAQALSRMVRQLQLVQRKLKSHSNKGLRRMLETAAQKRNRL